MHYRAGEQPLRGLWGREGAGGQGEGLGEWEEESAKCRARGGHEAGDVDSWEVERPGIAWEVEAEDTYQTSIVIVRFRFLSSFS